MGKMLDLAPVVNSGSGAPVSAFCFQFFLCKERSAKSKELRAMSKGQRAKRTEQGARSGERGPPRLLWSAPSLTAEATVRAPLPAPEAGAVPEHRTLNLEL